jgi:Plasmid pRiA4b ORF-3-like protein
MIWRRLLVSSSCTLEELHGIFQVAMGWESTAEVRLSAARARLTSQILMLPHTACVRYILQSQIMCVENGR